MNKQSGFAPAASLAVLAAIIVLGAIIWTASSSKNRSTNEAMMPVNKMEDNNQAATNKPDGMMENTNTDAAKDKMMGDEVKQDEAMKDTKEIMNDQGDKKDSAMTPPDAMMPKVGVYEDYSPATVLTEQAKGNKVVLFFHATWCPFCQAADKEFTSRASDIPAGVAVLKTDYDTNTSLKTKYGITYQHTFVQIDNQNNLVSKWNGGDIDNLNKYLK